MKESKKLRNQKELLFLREKNKKGDWKMKKYVLEEEENSDREDQREHSKENYFKHQKTVKKNPNILVENQHSKKHFQPSDNLPHSSSSSLFHNKRDQLIELKNKEQKWHFKKYSYNEKDHSQSSIDYQIKKSLLTSMVKKKKKKKKKKKIKLFFFFLLSPHRLTRKEE